MVPEAAHGLDIAGAEVNFVRSPPEQRAPKVSIVVPCKAIDNYTVQCVEHCLRLNYSGEVEVVVLPDCLTPQSVNFTCASPSVKIIETGDVTPGKKRNIGVEESSGDLIAFIDSDAYPQRNWLQNALKYFSDSRIAAVGGPGVTPDEDSDLQKVSGFIYSSPLMGGLRGRFQQLKPREVDDLHSCNMIVKREIFSKVRWNEKYWPGEDTLLCRDILKLGYKIIEAPNVVVYHHRKPVFKQHLKQVANFGLHRGFFAKKYPENSRKLVYFLPMLMVLYLTIGGILAFLHQLFGVFYAASVILYLLAALITSLHAKKPRLIALTWIGVILTHLIYGLSFLAGLLKRDLER